MTAPAATAAALGQSVRRHREAAGMSQADLARQMDSQGYGWFPQTVTKVESGARSIRLTEGIALARIFDVPPSRLASGALPAPEQIAVARAIRELEAAERAVSIALARRDHAAAMLEAAEADAEQVGS